MLMLDDKDNKIISVLRQNSRMAIRDVAKKAQLRPSTVHQRIQKLIANGVIEKFTLKLNNKAAGENFIVFMLVRGGTSEYLSKGIIGSKHVKEVFGVTGEYDVILKLKFSSIEEFNDFVISFRKKSPGVKSTVTMVVTAEIKEEL